MATLVHLTAIFGLPGPKNMSVNLDFETNLAVTDANLDEMVDRAKVEWEGGGVSLRTVYPNVITLERVIAFGYTVVPNLSPPPAFKRQLDIGPRETVSAFPGTVAEPPVPPQNSMVLSFKTPIGGKRRRGRIYTPPVSHLQLDAAGQMSAASATAFETKWKDWITAIEQSATPPQTYTHSIVSLAGNLVTGVTVYDFKRRVDTQRRRLLRTLDVG
jgi:hypothetical protein